ncbi:alpha/beta hydrolase [Paremcibacter congregatus]|uniref:alpha/beta hydrolase n=1 Tax=Paremcibacter congregatus TaxID=2043170 RepID=UPI003A929489
MTIDPQTAAILDILNQPVAAPPAEVTIIEARAGADALFTGFAGDKVATCETQDRQIPSPDDPVPVRIYTPPQAGDIPLPLVIFFHGGGWSLGNVAAYDSLVRALCVESNALFISVDYRLGPEHKYPAGLRDCRAVTNWALAQGTEIGADPDRIAVMGDSAGGTLATVVAHQINRADPGRVKAQVLIYPVMDLSRPHDHYPSRMTFGNGEYLLSRDGIDAAENWYLSPSEDRNAPEISPLRQPDLTPLPPTLMVVGGYDPLLDETVQYHEDLQKAGVASELLRYEGTIHAFLSFGCLDIAREARRYIGAQLRRLLAT